MKKIIIIVIAVIAIILISIFAIFSNKNSKNKEKNLKHVKVAEVTHSIFYAPQYLAISKGFFEEEGLDIELVLTPGADKVTASVLSGDVQIGFCGPEATIYVVNNLGK